MADAFMPEYWPANRIIGKLEKALVKAENILGLIQSAQIENLVAGKVTGLLTSAQIAEIEAAKVSGKLTSEQIESIKASQISGKLTNAQLESIEAAKITGVITETQIGPEAVTTPKLKAGAITTAKLAAGSVTAEILAAGSVTTEKLVAGSVNAGALAAGSVTTAKLAAEAITAEKIGAGQILTAKLAAGAVTAEKLSVVSLSAISANLGTITAGEMSAVDIFLPQSTGETIKSPSELSWENHEKIYGISPTESEDVLILQAGGVVAAKDRRGYIKAKVRKISAPTGYIEKTVINGNSESNFLQLLTARACFVFSGAISAAGAVLNGVGFSCERTSAGNYKIKLSTALTSAGSLFLEVNGAFTQIHKASGPSTSEWTVTINGFSGLGGGSVTLVATDEPFSFYIIQH